MALYILVCRQKEWYNNYVYKTSYTISVWR